MIDAERLLGKVLSGAVSSGGRKKRRNDDFVSSLLGGLTSGKGLVTAIGLGVGAYEILQGQKNGGQTMSSTPAPPPIGGGVSSTPPPVPGSSAPPAPPAPPTLEVQEKNELATSFLQVMIAAAHADGQLDSTEEERILEMLQQQGLTGEERRYLAAQLHAPKPIEELVAKVQGNPSASQTMYSMALTAIEVDTPAERQWLDSLAGALSISSAMQRFLEEDS